MRHLGADVLADPTGLLQRPFLVARGAETSPPAGKRNEKLLAAPGAADAGEALLEVATLQELAHDRPDDGPPETGVTFHRDTLYRFDASGDNWCLTWASDNSQVASMCDGNWLGGTPG